MKLDAAITDALRKHMDIWDALAVMRFTDQDLLLLREAAELLLHSAMVDQHELILSDTSGVLWLNIGKG